MMRPLPAVIPPLPAGASMAVWPLAATLDEGSDPGGLEPPLYCNGGKWLHPLFDLLELLESEGGDAGPAAEDAAEDVAEENAAFAAAGELFLRDRVIGRAAAFLALRAGIRCAYADLVSDGAVAVFEAAGATLGWGERIPAIGCATEAELRDVRDGDAAWPLLLARRKAAKPS